MPDRTRQIGRAGDGWTLRLERKVDAPLGQVYRAFTDPARIARWMGPEGYEASVDQFDFRVGGAYRLVLTAESGVRRPVSGEYIEIEDGRCIAFSWLWEHEGTTGVTTFVRFEFAVSGDGTAITLTHTGFPEQENAVAHGDGWTSTLNCLERAVI